MPERLDALPGGHDGIVVMLLPDAATAERFAVDAGVPVDELHLTLTYLGDTDDPPDDVDLDLLIEAAQALTDAGPVDALITGAAVLNPDDDEPATALLVQSEHVSALHDRIVAAVGESGDYPTFLPHVTLGYSIGPLTDGQAADRAGEARFDRVAVGWGQEGAAIIDLTGTGTDVDAVAAAASGLPAGWVGVLAPEATPTGDGRMFEDGALTWGDLPIPLRHTPADSGGHDGAVSVGMIEDIWREEGQIWGRGTFDLGSEAGREAARIVSDSPRGVSVDLDDVDLEVRLAADALAEDMEPVEMDAPDEDGRIVLYRWKADDELSVVTSGRIRAATILDIPAFIEAKIAVDPDAVATDVVVASSAAQPVARPASWFRQPEFTAEDLVVGPDGQTGCPLTITDDGRVYGHLALWRTCHTGYAAECVTPPSSEAGYRYFHTGSTVTDAGDIPTGRLTVDTLHAGRRLTATDTSAHYEHTGAAVADVVAGEDEHGIWVAGAIRDGVTAEQVSALRSSPLSGDWRRIGTSLELVAVLAVNSPGFPVPRALVAGGQVQTLQAGAQFPAEPDDVADILAELVERERTARASRSARADRARSTWRAARVAQAKARIGA